jgi:hypothetical protein
MTVTNTFCLPALADYDLKVPSISAGLTVWQESIAPIKRGNATIGEWVADSGDNKAPARLILRKQDATNPEGMEYNSMRLVFDQKRTSSLDDEVDYDEMEVVVAWQYKGDANPNPTYVTQALGVLFAIFAQELTGANGVPTTKVVDLFDIGAISGIVG